MDRRRAIGLATSVTVAAAGGIFAVGANLGLFGLASAESPPPLPVQQVSDASSDPAVAPAQQVIEETRVIDVPVRVPASASAADPATAADAVDDDDSSHDAYDDSYDDASSASSDSDDTSAVYEDDDDDAYESGEHEREDHECEVHDDGEVECHDEDD